MSHAAFAIFDIRQCPEHAEAVGAWVYQEWWTSRSTREAVTAWVRACERADGFPATLVAVLRGRAVGSVFLHLTEAEDRPDYRPYLGALFVRPSARGQGIGRALVQAAETHAASLGFSRMFLNAAPHRTSFYEPLGWSIVERGYDPHGLNILSRMLPRLQGA